MNTNTLENQNLFTDPTFVADYETWYTTAGRRADRLEKALLKRLLNCFSPVRSILEVGCGTGHFTRWFREQRLTAVGLDISNPMLTEAARLYSPPCVRGNGLDLPFPRGSFDLVALITTLEFIPEPVQVLTEAFRVASKGLILGVLNRQSWLGLHLKNEGGPLWDAAHFFTLRELVCLVRQATHGKPVNIAWQTTLWPVWPGTVSLPWGGFIGMAVRRNSKRRHESTSGRNSLSSLILRAHCQKQKRIF